jgi:hypothetical protein
VLIITLICMTLLVGLIFYVYNLGSEVNRRMALQHASDAAVVSGAGWMAREMNTVAMNNCEISRLLAMVPIFDALPMATSMALGEMAPWTQRLTEQLTSSIPETPANYQLLISGLMALQQRFQVQTNILTPMDMALNRSGFHMDQTTWWQPNSGGTGPGSLWQAMAALDRYNWAVVNSAGVFAQSEAVQFGTGDRSNMSLLVPVVPVMPAVRGVFHNFQPTLEGRERVQSESGVLESGNNGMGGAIPDAQYPHRLGPWARLWRWRQYFMSATEWKWNPPIPGGPGQTRGSRGNVNLGGRRSGTDVRGGGGWGTVGSWSATAWELRGYYTYGPYSWALRRLNWNELGNYDHPGQLRDSDFVNYVSRLSRAKLTYMFDNKATQYVHEPNWIIDYKQAQQTATANPGQVNRTMFYLVEVASSVPEGDPRWMTPGTFRTNGPNPIAIWSRGWVNTEDGRRWPIPKIADFVWKDYYSYQTTQDLQLGISLQRDATGAVIWQPVYMAAWYIWGGIDVGGTAAVSNPCNWSSEMDLPAPWLLDTSKGDYDPANLDPDQGARRAEFSYLAVSRNGNRAPFWSRQFRPALPDDLTAVAQAKVFNHSSWDLWTQDWQVQLTPVSQWGDWMRQLEQGLNAADNTEGLVRRADVQSALTYLKKMQALADGWMTH